MEQTEIKDKINNCLVEYYRLCNLYENNKTKYMNSIDDKKKYNRNNINCVYCDRKVGNIINKRGITQEGHPHMFQTEYIFKCGDTEQPCPLNIHFFREDSTLFEYLLNDYRKVINDLKKEIILMKNDVLFNYNKDDSTFNLFQEKTKTLQSEVEYYNNYLETYIDITDNPKKRIELKERLVSFGILLNAYKKMINDYKESREDKVLKNSNELYLNELKPLAEMIRTLTYSTNEVVTYKDMYVLLQEPISFKQITYDHRYTSGNIDYYMPSFNLGTQVKKKKSVKAVTRKISQKPTATKTRKIIEEEPIEEPIEEEIDIPTNLPPVTDRPTIAPPKTTPIIPAKGVVENIPTKSSSVIYQIEFKPGSKSVVSTISGKQIKPSSYHVSIQKEKEILNYIRKNYSNTSIVCIWYGVDTQFGISESPKTIDKLPVDTAQRGVLEETGLDIPKQNYKQFGDIFVSQKIRGVTNIAMFTINIDDVRENIKHVEDVSMYDNIPDNTGENAVKAFVALVGNQDQLVELLSTAKSNESSSGYHIIPVMDPILDTFVR